MEAEISLNHSNADTLFQENCCKNWEQECEITVMRKK
jgi:hypothetical protein